MSEPSLGASLVARSLDASRHLETVELRARQCLIDWIGVIFGAVSEPGVRLSDARPGTEVATDILTGSLREPAEAAFANAFRAHQLDFDDFHLEVPGHASASVLGSAFALAEARDTTFGELLAASVAGVEAVTLLGRVYGATLFARGWHPTSVFGSVGAGMASAAILGLSPEEALDAVGLSALQASGSMAGFGSIGKPWQVGAAARNGLSAARSAALLESHLPDLLDGPHGVFSLMIGEQRDDDPEALAPDRLPRIWDTQFKYFASCFGTHAAVRAARRLRDENDLLPSDIEEVEIGVGPSFEHVVINANPRDIYEAKFSVSGTVALTLIGSPPTVPDFFPRALRENPDYMRIEQCTEAIADGEIIGGGARVSLRLRDGRRLETSEDETSPADRERETVEVLDKFLELTSPVLGDRSAQALGDWMLEAPLEAPVSELSRTIRR